MDEKLYRIEDEILNRLVGRFVNVEKTERRNELIKLTAKSIQPDMGDDDINTLISDINDLSPIDVLMKDESIEDIMINNTKSVFVYDSKEGAWHAV